MNIEFNNKKPSIKTIKISVIIPAYNSAKFINKCISSIINQNLQQEEYEIIIVNDGSTDNTLAIAKKILAVRNNISIITQKNKGLSSARNTGLKAAKGKYIWFVDSDDWVENNCLAEITSVCFNNNLDILSIEATNVINDKHSISRLNKINYNKIYTGHEILVQGKYHTCAPFHIYAKNFLIKNDLTFLEGIFHEDNEFTPRAIEKANRYMACKMPYYFVLVRPGSITRSANPKKSFDLLLVAESLSDYCLTQKLKGNVEKSINRNIGLAINNALYGVLNIPDQQKILLNILKKKKELLTRMKRSGSTKYYIESIVLMNPMIFRFFYNIYKKLWHISG